MDKIVFGALPKIAKEEVSNLRRIGLDASLLLIKRGAELQDIGFKNLKTEVLEDQSSVLSKMSLKIPGFSFFSSFHLLAPLLAVRFRVRYDLLLTHGTYTCFTAYSLRKTKGIPYFAYIYDPITYILRKVYSESSLGHLLPILSPIGEKLDRLIVNSSEAVILLSKYHWARIKEMTNKPVHIVYPGTEFAERIPRERGNYLLAVARWERGKNPFFLLEVLKVLRREGVKASLIMDGSWKPPTFRTQFLQEVKKEKLQDQVVVIGPAGREDLSKLYLGARALIHPTAEAFGMIGLEAAAHGAPIIVSKGSGVTDLFEHGVQGFFPDEGDIDAYARFAGELMGSERDAWRMGHRAWEVAKNFTWETHARALSNVLGVSGWIK